MACTGITTGAHFLSGMLLHIDCQARGIGSYGYGALADPRSTAFAVTAGLLSIFIALHGLSLLFGGEGYAKRLIHDILKAGIVLTLATSWPAFRILAFDLVMDGPAELAEQIGFASGLPSTREGGFAQLQAMDDAIVVATVYGTGRYVGGGTPQGAEAGDSFAGIALSDQFALGWGRSSFLIGATVPFGIARLGAGLLLALAPILAGLYLFGATSGIFLGWARALLFCALAAFAQSLVQAVEIELLGPWIQSVVLARQGGAATPSAPTELLAAALSFSVISLGVMTILARLSFFQGTTMPVWLFGERGSSQHRTHESDVRHRQSETLMATRAQLVASAVAQSMRHEALMPARTNLIGLGTGSGRSAAASAVVEQRGPSVRAQAGGDLSRRAARRSSASSQQRDGR